VHGPPGPDADHHATRAHIFYNIIGVVNDGIVGEYGRIALIIVELHLGSKKVVHQKYYAFEGVKRL